jgi:hypothetical protein
VRESTDTACPEEVETEIRPEVAPMDWSSFAVTVIVTVSPELLEILLFLQNFTVTVPEKPVPVIVRVPPPDSEIEVVDNDVIEGGKTVEVSSDVAPLRATVAPPPVSPVGWLFTKVRKRIVAVTVSAM